MKRVIYYLRLALPVILVIFILGAKPSKAKGQDTEKVKVKKEKTSYIVVSDGEDGAVKTDKFVICTGDDDDFDLVYDYDFEFDTSIVSKNCAAIKLKMDSKGHAYVITSEDGEEKKVRLKLMSSDDDTWTIITEDDEDGEEVTTITIRKKEGKDGEERYILKKKSKEKETKKKEKK